jgi:hypothetical protein
MSDNREPKFGHASIKKLMYNRFFKSIHRRNIRVVFVANKGKNLTQTL